MKLTRVEKLKLVKATLEGDTALLKRYASRQKRDALPYLDVRGIISFHNVPEILMDTTVVYHYFSTLNDRQECQTSLKECISRYKACPDFLKGLFGSIGGFIDAESDELDGIQLDAIELKNTDYKTIYTSGTIADLREYDRKSQYRNSIKEFGLQLVFFSVETDSSKLEFILKKLTSPV